MKVEIMPVTAFNNQQKINTSFQAKISDAKRKSFMEQGYNIYENPVYLKSQGKNISGAAFVKDSGYEIDMLITDDKCEPLGNINARNFNSYAAVSDDAISNKEITNLGKTAYKSLFNYIKNHYPSIKRVVASVSDNEDNARKFYIDCGFHERENSKCTDNLGIRFLDYIIM